MLPCISLDVAHVLLSYVQDVVVMRMMMNAPHIMRMLPVSVGMSVLHAPASVFLLHIRRVLGMQTKPISLGNGVRIQVVRGEQFTTLHLLLQIAANRAGHRDGGASGVFVMVFSVILIVVILIIPPANSYPARTCRRQHCLNRPHSPAWPPL